MAGRPRRKVIRKAGKALAEDQLWRMSLPGVWSQSSLLSPPPRVGVKGVFRPCTVYNGDYPRSMGMAVKVNHS